jgi:hypothetical protein
MIVSEEMAALVVVVNALDVLGVPYALGGSLASAVHGVVRAPWMAPLLAETYLNEARQGLEQRGYSTEE